MDERGKTVGVGDLEATAIELIRRARRSCEHLGEMGYRFVGVADWLEGEVVPRVAAACRDGIRAAFQELTGSAPPEDEN